jgi:thiamine transport system permease protein
VRGPRLRLSATLLAIPGAFLALFFAYPLAEVLGAVTPAAFEWLGDRYVRGRIAVAFLQAIASLALTLALALPLAWMYHTRRIPGARLQRAIHAAPFVLPVFVVVYGLQDILGTGGAVHRGTGFDVLAAAGPFGAVVMANTFYNYGFAARLLFGALETRPRRLEEAAQVLGASERRAFLRVTLPLLLPAVASVALLVFLFCFASFAVVLLLGQGQVSTFETLLYQNLGGYRPRPDRAAALGMAQLALNLLGLGAFLALRRHHSPAAPEADKPRAGPARILLAWMLVLAALLPAASVLAGGFQVGGAWSLEPWRSLMDEDHARHVAGFVLPQVVVRSLVYAIGAAAFAIGLVAALLYGARRSSGAMRRSVEGLAAIPLATSSLLLGFALFAAFGPGSWLDLRGDPWAILVAHTLVTFPFVARVLLPAFDARDVRLDETAGLLGASPMAVALRIHLPALAGPLAAAAGLAMALSLGDYGSSLLLMRSDTAGLAVWVTRHDRPFDPFAHAQATALAGLLCVLAAASYIVMEFASPAAWRRQQARVPVGDATRGDAPGGR